MGGWAGILCLGQAMLQWQQGSCCCVYIPWLIVHPHPLFRTHVLHSLHIPITPSLSSLVQPAARSTCLHLFDLIMKPAVFLLPVGSYSFNLLATSQEQPTHVNRRGGAPRKVLEEEEEEVVVVMRLAQGGGDCDGGTRMRWWLWWHGWYEDKVASTRRRRRWWWWHERWWWWWRGRYNNKEVVVVTRLVREWGGGGDVAGTTTRRWWRWRGQYKNEVVVVMRPVREQGGGGDVARMSTSTGALSVSEDSRVHQQPPATSPSSSSCPLTLVSCEPAI